MRRILMALFMTFLACIFMPEDAALADDIQFEVNGIGYSFNTGDGTDGNLEFRADGMYVNGVKKCSPSGSRVILGNLMESCHSDLTYYYYLLENVTTYLPVNKVYSPSATVPGSGSIPNFENLTIFPGVMVTSNNNAVHFKVRRTLRIEGAILSKHGAAGSAGTNYCNAGNGGDAGNIIILAGSINVAPNGTSGGNGAILSGFGGGGGGGMAWQNGGNGGRGGDLTIYCNSLGNNGEIRSGNGGGGGGEYINGVYDPLRERYDYFAAPGAGGLSGKLTIRAFFVTNYSIIGAGVGGSSGQGEGERSSGSIRRSYTWGGYGSGGNGWGMRDYYDYERRQHNDVYADPKGGESEGRVSQTQNYYYNGCVVITQPGAGSGYGQTGYGNPGPGSLEIVADTVNAWSWMMTGYTAGTGSTGGTDEINISINNCVASFDTLQFGARTSTKRILVNGNFNLGNTLSAVQELKVGGNLSINGNAGLNVASLRAGGLSVNGSCLVVTNGLVNGVMNISPDSTLAGSFGTPAEPVGNAVIKGNLNNVTINASGDVRFSGNDNYRLDAWWTGRTVTVNGLRIRGATQAAAPNSTGINEVGLTDWISKYNPTGALPVMSFIVERRPDGLITWDFSECFNRNLSGNVTWQDLKTEIKNIITYRVGFKDPSSSLGFIYIENITAASKSEGGGLDEFAPLIEDFSIWDGFSDTTVVTTRLVKAKIRASDNRTPASKLLTRIEVNCVPYVWDAGLDQFLHTSGWGDYCPEMSGLDMGVDNGNLTVALYVRDEAGNTASKTLFTRLAIPNRLTEGAVAAPLAVAGRYKGEDCFFVTGNRVSLSPVFPNAVKIRYSFDGGAYGPWREYTSDLKITLPKSTGATNVAVQAIDANGRFSIEKEIVIVSDDLPPEISLKTVSGAVATSGNSIQVVVTVIDNISTSFEYSLDGANYHTLPENRIITIPITSQGNNVKRVWVSDQAGNAGSTHITIRKI